MSSASTKIIQAAAGNADKALYVEDVFSTYLYEGTGVSHTIQNGIDLTEGGLVWTKSRGAHNHYLFDSARGVTCALQSNTTNIQYCDSTQVSAFTSDGFTVGTDGSANLNGRDYVSWTFRKAPKFFDVVTWTGDGSAGPFTLSHNLGSSVGMSVVKVTSHTGDWITNHRSVPTKYLALNSSASAQTDVTMTSTDSTITFNGSNVYYNFSGRNYVAYLFAHNDGDGEFGEDADQDIIKCGSFTADNAGGGAYTGAATVNLGFEPQFVILKQVDSTLSVPDWMILDTMRGYRARENTASDIGQQRLLANASSSEVTSGGASFPTSTGFGALQLTGGATYIYMAIRRGPMKTPTLGTEVFTAATTGTSDNTEFRPENVDMAMFAKRGGDSENFQVADRVRGFQSTNTNSDDGYTTATLETNNSNAEDTSGTSIHQTEGQDSGGGPYVRSASSGSNFLMYRFKRAPGFFDLVAYAGDGTSGRTVSHNLGVAPELTVVKRRNSSALWVVGSSLFSNPANHSLSLNESSPISTGNYFNSFSQNSFQLGSYNLLHTNNSSSTYIAYLFATLPGISKVGSYTGNGSTQIIDCGFSAGARFVLIKRTDGSGDWNLWDSERGIVAGNDPKLELNTTDAQIADEDFIDPDSSGFALFNKADNNANGQEYIFLAIA